MSYTGIEDHVSDRLGEHLEGDLSLAEFARVDSHLKRCEDCANELRELRAVVAMLRELPDPEPPVALVARVAARIESGEGRRTSNVVRLLRHFGEPRFATALAAGCAGLLAVASFSLGSGNFLGAPAGPSQEQVALQSDFGSATNVRVASARRPRSLPRTPVALLTGNSDFPVSRVAHSGTLHANADSGYGFYGNAAPEIPLRDLDGELESLMKDPAAFVERLRHVEEASRRSLIAPLIQHSARRGDVATVARYTSAVAQPTAIQASATR